MMEKSRFSPAQIADILKEFEDGKSAEDITCEHGVSKASLYQMETALNNIDLQYIQSGKPTKNAYVLEDLIRPAGMLSWTLIY